MESPMSSALLTPTASTPISRRSTQRGSRSLARALERERSALTLGIGSDFHLSYDNIESLKTTPSRYTINGKDYLLVELPDFGGFRGAPDYGLPSGLSETFHQMQLAGLTPILTHPERNPTLQSRHRRVWRTGCAVGYC